ncbi:hypothetical protein ACOSP6_07105 [Tenacibaculum sp. MEBiC06402]|uniref:hypothetical protein n=1 Tax=unclassified Tenacibaculum TaxID=2635139 RepID=UPI003B9C6EFB
MKRKVLLSLFSFVLSLNVFAQQFPVNIIPRVKAPAPVNFYNYADDTALDGPITVQIFLNDLTVSSRQIRLKTYFEGGNISFTSKDFVIGAQDLFIEGGIPLTLTNTELAPYYRFENIQGIGQTVYAQSIPEGTYNFCFEVYDYLSGAKLSDKKCATVFIFKNEPPILNLPFNGKNIEPSDFENIVFQWTPRHINVSNVEYDFSIVEIWDINVDPQTAFLSQAPIYEETVRTTSLFYGPDKPLLLAGRKYAWRVRARALQGLEEIGLFKNEGYSEIFWFSRTAPCQIPDGVSAEPKGTSKINVFWDQDPTLHSEYIIAYREANNPDANWFTKKTNSAWATIWDLKAGTTYEYKVKGKCQYQYSEYSELQYVTTDIVQNEDANYNCGIVPDEIAIANREPHPGLSIGDQITAGDFKITITDIQSQSSGVLSGKGFVAIPYLKFAKFGVTFTNILVNTDAQLAEGEIVTLYDPEFGEGASMTVDVNINISEGIGGDPGDLEETVEVGFEVATVVIDANGAIVVTGTNGETATIPGDGDVNIVSTNGDIWAVGDDGTITKQEGAAGGAVSSATTNGLDSNGNVMSITAKGIKIEFQPSGFYHFDELPENTSATFEKEYKILDTESGKYRVPYKAISDNEGEDFINAKVTITDTSISKDSIVFKTKDGAKVPVEWSGDIAKLQLKRKFDYADEEIFAVVKSKDNGKYDIAGSVITAHLASEQLEPINVTLVPVGIDKVSDEVKNGVKEIYAKAGVRLNIQDVKSISPEEIYGWDKDGDNRLSVGDSNLLSHYTDEEAAFNSYIKQQSYYNNKTYYVFVTNVPVTKTEVEGFMPLKRQFGYVFTANANTATKKIRTMAHELGHGIFGLKHTWDEYQFPQGATDHLMDYGNGTTLNHLDWKKIHAPGIQIYWFQGDEDGEFAGNYAIAPNFKFVFINDSKTLHTTGTNYTVTGTLPGFKILDDNNNLKKSFSWDYAKEQYVNDRDSTDIYPISEFRTVLPSKTGVNLFYNLEKNCGLKSYINLSYDEISGHQENITQGPDPEKYLLNLISEYTSTRSKGIPCSGSNSNNGWREIPIDCSSADISLLTAADVDKIEGLVNESDSSKIVEAINEINYKCVFENVENSILIDLIIKLGSDSVILNSKEKAILRLLKFVKRERVNDLFVKLKETGVYENMINSFHGELLLFIGDDNKTSMYQVFAHHFSQLTKDEDKWYLINTLIKEKYNFTGEDYFNDYVLSLLLSTNEYASKKDQLTQVSSLFTEMLIMDCKNLEDYKVVLDIAFTRHNNKQAFYGFTQTKSIVNKYPGCEDVSTMSWVKPKEFELRCHSSVFLVKLLQSAFDGQSDQEKEVKMLVDEYAWAKYIYEENDAMLSLHTSNISEYLEVFKRELNNYIENQEEYNSNFWESTTIDCENVAKVFNQVRLNENDETLKKLDKSTRVSLLNLYFESCGYDYTQQHYEYEDSEKLILTLLTSFDDNDKTVLEVLENIGIKNVYEKLKSKEKFETLAKVLVWMGGQIQNSGHFEALTPSEILNSDNEIKDYSNLLGLESNMFQFDNFSVDEITSDGRFHINNKYYNYNKMVVVYAADDFEFLGQKFKKGDVLTMPLIQAFAMHRSNRNIVGEKIAWTAVDVVLLAVGYGEIKILFTAGNYLRKAFIVGDLVGASAGILANVVNESALSQEARFNLQMLAILASLPQVATSIGKIDNIVSMIDDEINALSNVNHKQGLETYFESVKSRLPIKTDLSGFLNVLKEKNIIDSYNGLSNNLKQLFQKDFLNATDEILDTLKNSDVFNYWKQYRIDNPNAIICN